MLPALPPAFSDLNLETLRQQLELPFAENHSGLNDQIYSDPNLYFGLENLAQDRWNQASDHLQPELKPLPGQVYSGSDHLFA